MSLAVEIFTSALTWARSSFFRLYSPRPFQMPKSTPRTTRTVSGNIIDLLFRTIAIISRMTDTMTTAAVNFKENGMLINWTDRKSYRNNTRHPASLMLIALIVFDKRKVAFALSFFIPAKLFFTFLQTYVATDTAEYYFHQVVHRGFVTKAFKINIPGTRMIIFFNNKTVRREASQLFKKTLFAVHALIQQLHFQIMIVHPHFAY